MSNKILHRRFVCAESDISFENDYILVKESK